MTITLLPNIFHRIGDELLETHRYLFESVTIRRGHEVLIERCIYCGKLKPCSKVAIPDPYSSDGHLVLNTPALRMGEQGDTDR